MKTDPVKILKQLRKTSKNYDKKVLILSKLINDPDGGHIIDGDLIAWAGKSGIKTTLHAEDGTTWWTCRIENKKNI